MAEKSWLYRLAKRFWFNDFGVYNGHDHSRAAAPGILNGNEEKHRHEETVGAVS